MRLFLGVLLIATTMIPAEIYGQADAQSEINALLAKIQEIQKELHARGVSSAPPVVGGQCPIFTRTLTRGSRGDDVAELQRLLIGKRYLQSEVTGYFGALTENALQAFQSAEGIVAGGSPAATGWGVFGPRTRALLSRCDTVPPPVPVCAPPPQPDQLCDGLWEAIQKDTCVTGWQCKEAPQAFGRNQAPKILGIEGPTSLAAGEIGRWRVNAEDPEQGTLRYAVTWGDEGADSLLQLLAGGNSLSFGSSPSFMHSYRGVGTFVVQMTVRDGGGNETSSALSVQVVPRSVSNPFATSTATSTVPVVPQSPYACIYQGKTYPEGTTTEGLSVNDLCLATAGVCVNRTAYMPKFTCDAGKWREVAGTDSSGLPSYGNVVGTACSSNGATMMVSVAPNTQLCRNLLCALTQNYAKISLRCQYTNWVDWGLFRGGATTTSVCEPARPCEYWFGDQGKACAPKVNGTCPVPSSNHPLGY